MSTTVSGILVIVKLEDRNNILIPIHIDSFVFYVRKIYRYYLYTYILRTKNKNLANACIYWENWTSFLIIPIQIDS